MGGINAGSARNRSDQLARTGSPPHAGLSAHRSHDGYHEQERQKKARQEPGKIEFGHRRVGEQSIEDQVDGGRDENAQRPAGGDRAKEQRLVVAALFDLRDGHGADGCGRGDGRSRCGGEQRARPDIGMHQAAGQPAKPFDDAFVHAFGDAGAQEDFAEQNEHRDRHQQKVGSGLPHHVAQGAVQRHRAFEILQDEAEPAERGGDGDGEGDQSDENEKGFGDHVKRSRRRSARRSSWFQSRRSWP